MKHRRRDREGLAVDGQDTFAAVQQPAQHEEDQSGAERQEERRLPSGPEVADHVHVLVLARLVDQCRCRRSARLDARRHERGDLDDGVVRLVPEREQIEAADHRVALAARVEHVHRPGLAGGEGVGLLEQLGRGGRRLAEPWIRLLQRHPALLLEVGGDELGLLREREVLGDLDALVEHPGLVERVGVLQHGAPRDGLPRRLRALQPDAVDHPDDAHQGHPAGEPGEGDEEAESRTEVGGEEQVDAAAERDHRDDHDEHAAELGLPADREQRVHHNPRMYSMMASSCSSVSIAPNPGIRPLPCD